MKPTSNHSRWVVLTGLVVAYAAAFQLLYPVAGPGVASLSFLPVLAAAGSYGRRGAYPMVAAMSAVSAISFATLPNPADKPPGWTVVVAAISLLVVAELMSRLRSSNVRLARLVDSKDEFLASVSHELRTPLTAVIGFSDLLTTEWSRMTESERAELTDEIEVQAREMSTIIDDLLVAARVELGHLTAVRQAVPVADAVETAISALPELRDREVYVSVSPELIAVADAGRVRHILRNLLANSLQHGGGTVWIAADTTRERVRITVADSGEGLPPSEWERIFEAYHRGNIVGRPGGIGIGLTVSRTLARLMGGDLTYRRAAALSLFELTLPADGTVDRVTTGRHRAP